MAIITLTGVNQSNFLDNSNGIQQSNITTRQAGITTSQSFDEWRKFTNALGEDIGILARELTLLNNAGTPADDSTFTGITTLNTLKLGGHNINDVRLDNELRALASASDSALVTEKLLAGTKGDIDAAIALKSNITSPAFLNSAQLTHSSDTIFKVKTTNTSSDAEFVLAGGTASGFARIKFQDNANPNAYIYVNKSGAMTVKAQSLNLNAAGVISGVGSGLTSLNASNLSSGTIADARIPSTITRDTELAAFTGTANISAVGTITSGTWQGTAIANAYVAALPTSKITSGTFANARISQSSVTQHQGAITSVGTLTGLTINSANNVTAAKAPSDNNHLTNKGYVDTQVATKDNYTSWSLKAQSGDATSVSSGNVVDFKVDGTTESTAITFTRNSRRIGLDLNLANLDATKDGIIPSAILPDLVIGDFSSATIQTAAEIGSSFGDNDTSLLTAAAINDLITSKLGDQLNDTITGSFVSHIDAGAGINAGTVDGGGGISLALDQSAFNTIAHTGTDAIVGTDYLLVGDGNAVTPKRIQLTNLDISLLDHNNKISLAELSDVDDSAATTGEFLKWTGSEWIGDNLNNKVSISNLTNVTSADTGNTTGDLLRWNGSNWTNSTATQVAQYVDSYIDLADLGNVTASNPATGHFLKWSGNSWISSVDNNTTYSAGTGITRNSTTFSLRNSGNLTNNQLMKWNSASGQLVNADISVGTSRVDFGNRDLLFSDSGNTGDRIIITSETDASEAGSTSGTLSISNAAVFYNGNTALTTRKAGISFGDTNATGVNDPGFIVHETSVDNNNATGNASVIHLSPGDDEANSTDYVVIKGFNKAESTGLRLGTGGDLKYVNDIYQRARNGTSHPSKWTDDGIHVARSNSSGNTNQRGGRIYLQKGNHPDKDYGTEAWSIVPSSGVASGRDDLIIVEDNESGDATTALRIREDDHVVMAPNAAAADITGDHDLVTVEKLNAVVNAAVAPISKPDILRFCPQGFIYTRSESTGTYDSDSFHYWRSDNGYITVHLDNLDDWAIKGDSSKVSGQNTTFDGYYVIDFRLYREGRGGDGDDSASGQSHPGTHSARTGSYHGTARVATTSDNPSGSYNIFTNLNVNLYGTDSQGGGPQFGDWDLEVRDAMSGKSAVFRIDFKSWSRNTSGTKSTAERTTAYTMQDMDTFRGGSSTHITNSSQYVTD